MSDYFTYSFYLHEAEDFKHAKQLVDSGDVEGSLKRLGFSESIAAQDEEAEGVSVDQVNGIRLSLMSYKTNPYLLLACKKLGCEFVRVEHESDSSDSQNESYYHRGKKVAEEHVVVLRRVYCPELARGKRVSSVFETRDLATLKKELADGLDPDSLFDGVPLLFKSVNYPEATRYLLDQGANPDIRNNEGQTLLMSFIAEEQREYTHIAHLLVDKGAGLNLEMADEGGSLLWHTMRWDHGLAQAMQEKGAVSVAPDNVYAEDDPAEQLRTAVLHHDTPMLEKLWGQSEMSAEALHECVEACIEADNLPVLERLLKAGYHWEDEEGEKQLAPLLSMALSCRSFAVAMYLIEQAEAQQLDWSEVSTYELAEAAGHAGSTEVLQKMLPHYGDLLKEAPGSNGLRDAITGGAAENVRVLIEAGATLDYVDKRGGGNVPVLADCVDSLSASLAQQLMAAGADPFMAYTDPDTQTIRTAATMVLKERRNRDPEVVALFAEALRLHEADAETDTAPVTVEDFTVYSPVRESASFQEDAVAARLPSKQAGAFYQQGLVKVKRMMSGFSKNKKNQRNNDHSGLAGNATEHNHDHLLMDEWEEA